MSTVSIKLEEESKNKKEEEVGVVNMEESYNEDRVGKIVTRTGPKEKDSEVTLVFQAWVKVKQFGQEAIWVPAGFKEDANFCFRCAKLKMKDKIYKT